MQLQQAAIPPVGESRDELRKWTQILRRIDPDLAARHLEPFTAEDAVTLMLAAGDRPEGPTYGMRLEDLRRTGPAQRGRPRRALPRTDP